MMGSGGGGVLARNDLGEGGWGLECGRREGGGSGLEPDDGTGAMGGGWDQAGWAERVAQEWASRVEARQTRVAVLGLGYVGLPLVELFARAGFPVLGFDVDAHKVALLNQGRSYIGHVGSDRIRALRQTGRFEATTEPARLAEADALLICVPTPLGEHREPDLTAVVATGRTIAAALRPGMLVVLESTTYPGTTREVLRPVLETSGLRAGVEFFLAYSPEREDPGNPKHSAGLIPKVVGGFDDHSARAAQALYAAVVPQVVPVSSCEVAEACKLLENTYRAVNIALVNELKVLLTAMGLDVWEVIDAAKTKPFGFQAFYPGPGLGGHCIPIDPFYLSWISRRYERTTRFIELAGEINTAMPDYVLERLGSALNDRGKPFKGSRVLVLGAAYKKDVDDPRESPSFVLMEKLRARGALVSYNDPHIPTLPPMRKHSIQLESVELTAERLCQSDAVLICTDHSAYDWAFIAQHAPLLIDTRGATRHLPAELRARVVSA